MPSWARTIDAAIAKPSPAPSGAELDRVRPAPLTNGSVRVAASAGARTRAAVLDDQRARKGRHPHPSVLDVVDDGVGDQVRRQHLEKVGVALHHRGLEGRRDADAARRSIRLRSLDRIRSHLRQIDRSPFDGGPAADTREGQQCLGRGDRPLVGRGDAREKNVDVATGRIGPRHLDHGADDRVRSAQFVRRVRGEAPLLVDGELDAVEHRVEACRRDP